MSQRVVILHRQLGAMLKGCHASQRTVHSAQCDFALPYVTVSILCPQSRREVSTPTQLGKGQQNFSIKVTWEMRRRVAGYDPILIKVAYLDETLPPLVLNNPSPRRTNGTKHAIDNRN